jgi:hypothetical protein
VRRLRSGGAAGIMTSPARYPYGEGVMNLGVLLLYCKDTDEVRAANALPFSRFTREWAAGAVGRVASYLFAQSGGRETVTFKVFDWIKLSKTESEWSALGFGALAALRKEIEGKTLESLDPFTHILIGIDHSTSGGGSTPGALTHLAASNFTPSLIAHELGHRYGAPDAFGETADGETRYANRFCVMGGLGWPAVFADGAIPDPTAQMLNQSGPGMSAPTLMATGWLKEDEHASGVELSDTSLFSTGGAVCELAALAGAPGPLSTRPPVVARYHDLVIEYRVASDGGWDRGLPDPGSGAGGWVVVHRSDRTAPRALYVDAVAARPGAVLVLGKDDPVDLFNPGPVRVSILSSDATARTVRIGLARRAARPLPSGTTHVGVDVGGGGLVWTPGRGFVRVPPHSPLIEVLDGLARIQGLQDSMAIASRDEAEGLAREATEVVRGLERTVAGLAVRPSVSPLAHALETISRLGEERGTTRTSVERSRQLAEVRQILARAVEEERQR